MSELEIIMHKATGEALKSHLHPEYKTISGETRREDKHLLSITPDESHVKIIGQLREYVHEKPEEFESTSRKNRIHHAPTGMIFDFGSDFVNVTLNTAQLNEIKEKYDLIPAPKENEYERKSTPVKHTVDQIDLAKTTKPPEKKKGGFKWPWKKKD